jgi:hypothetical protein
MKPMLIFQLPDGYSHKEKMEVIRTIEDGFDKGSLILDSEITILSFDDNGKMNYCTNKYTTK